MARWAWRFHATREQLGKIKHKVQVRRSTRASSEDGGEEVAPEHCARVAREDSQTQRDTK